MKKLLTILSFFVFTTSYSQIKELNFTAVGTELHFKNSEGNWDLYQKNGKTDIAVKIEKNILTVYAESPSMYRLDGNSVVDINVKSFTGVSYIAKELKKDLKCRVDILKHKDSQYYILSIFYDDVNLRYTLEEN